MLDLLTYGCVEAVNVDDDIVLIQLVEIARVAGQGEALTFVDIAVQADCTLAAGCYRIDSKLRAGVAIAADENVALRGLESYGVFLRPI